jgi:hypothetical protein
MLSVLVTYVVGISSRAAHVLDSRVVRYTCCLYLHLHIEQHVIGAMHEQTGTPTQPLYTATFSSYPLGYDEFVFGVRG